MYCNIKNIVDYIRVDESKEVFYIYKESNIWKMTNEKNYKSRIQNEREIQSFDGFDTAEEIIEYMNKWFPNKNIEYIVK